MISFKPCKYRDEIVLKNREGIVCKRDTHKKPEWVCTGRPDRCMFYEEEVENEIVEWHDWKYWRDKE